MFSKSSFPISFLPKEDNKTLNTISKGIFQKSEIMLSDTDQHERNGYKYA